MILLTMMFYILLSCEKNNRFFKRTFKLGNFTDKTAHIANQVSGVIRKRCQRKGFFLIGC